MNISLGLGFALLLSAVLATAAGAQTQDPVLSLADGTATPTQITVPAGKPFTLTVRNTGKTPAEFESHRLHVEKILPPGKEVQLKLTLPKGRYPFVDEFHPAARGTLVAE
ncbi:MAG: cupredoxin domain-containing protein [Paracoccaceae bacterium]|nr:cupredoxin domain-containing protein [Paracoccaceae bacterium]MDE3239834.1 cupredoxin domain-containing protein [Paracoccaceae bacterium]